MLIILWLPDDTENRKVAQQKGDKRYVLPPTVAKSMINLKGMDGGCCTWILTKYPTHFPVPYPPSASLAKKVPYPGRILGQDPQKL
jgi:hypothetical protein